MIIDVKKCIEFPVENGGKKLLAIGRHTVDDNSLQHWFVDALIKEGSIVLLGHDVPKLPELIYPDKPVTQRIEVHGVSLRGNTVEAKAVPVFDEKEIDTIKDYLATDKKKVSKPVAAKKATPVTKKAPTVVIKRRVK